MYCRLYARINQWSTLIHIISGINTVILLANTIIANITKARVPKYHSLSVTGDSLDKNSLVRPTVKNDFLRLFFKSRAHKTKIRTITKTQINSPNIQHL